ncbi:MAG: hypothetical protein DSZ07_06120 [Sulfurovum sp.]|nr:MAG: hypothetical protein DSZ07_06120 [Sulfurovum sp.]
MERVKVKKIEIINFKGIEHLELDFTYLDSDRILDNIVFYGINGSGKSSILEAIYLSLISTILYPIDIKSIEKHFIQKFSLGKNWIYKNKQEFMINIQILDNLNTIETQLSYSKKKGLSCSVKKENEISEKFKHSIEFLSAYRLFYPSKVHHAGDWNKIDNDSSIIKNHDLGLQFTNRYDNVKQYLVNLITDEKVGVINQKNLEILEKIKQAFKIFFPNKVFLEQLARSDMNQDYKFLIQNEDKSIVDIDQLSSGEREIIAFFTYLCTHAINKSIIIIDEPELHLHDKWQSILLYAIHKLFPNVQLFLATHSETIHQSLSESELFELVK